MVWQWRRACLAGLLLSVEALVTRRQSVTHVRRQASFLDGAGESIRSIGSGVLADADAFRSVAEPALETVHFPEVVAAGTVLAMVATGARLLGTYAEAAPKVEVDVYPTGRYSPMDSAVYFERRPIETILRGATISTPAALFGLSLLADQVLVPASDTEGRAARRTLRSKELVATLTRLGPTFVKVGQALSMRSDLLPLEYCAELTTLQDAVPPFDDAEAKRCIAKSLGVARLEEIFESLGSEPVASASLGQVYKARLRDSGIEVAVKVQRPRVTETIALDLFLLRAAAPVLKKLIGFQTDLVGIVDTWGERFVDELDYVREAKNAISFTEAIAMTPLAGAVFAPPVITEASSKRVLTTKWVDGTRLDKESKEDVTALCSVAMNTYLTMMLETGILHADPHPGNLLVETGTRRLAILDWGLVTELDPSLRIAYIEHIAHLVAKDYEAVPADLVALGFVPPGLEEAIKSSDAVEVLTDVYAQFAGGGGAAKIDVAAVLASLKALADRQGNIFQLPPYFAYIARAFSVLEGIGLTNDPDYAIVKECLPYISQRLLSDTDPRVASALETFVYTRPHANRPRSVDATRLEYLTDGFSSYSASADNKKQDEHNTLMIAEKIAELLLVQGDASTPLQDIVETEIAKLVGASARSTASRIRDTPAARAAARFIDPFGVLEAIATGPLVQPDRVDTVSLAVASRIQKKAAPDLEGALSAFQDMPAEKRLETLTALSNILWKNRDGVSKQARRVAIKVADQTASRLNSNTPQLD